MCTTEGCVRVRPKCMCVCGVCVRQRRVCTCARQNVCVRQRCVTVCGGDVYVCGRGMCARAAEMFIVCVRQRCVCACGRDVCVCGKMCMCAAAICACDAEVFMCAVDMHVRAARAAEVYVCVRQEMRVWVPPSNPQPPHTHTLLAGRCPRLYLWLW